MSDTNKNDSPDLQSDATLARSEFSIVIRTAALISIFFIISFVYLNVFGADTINTMSQAGQDGNQEVFDESLSQLAKMIQPLNLLFAAFFTAFLHRIGYRYFDIILLLLPVVSIWFFFKWSRRIASLPYRYWESQPASKTKTPVAIDNKKDFFDK